MNLSGFGSVYLVEDSKNYKQFALKRIKCENKTELVNLKKTIFDQKIQFGFN